MYRGIRADSTILPILDNDEVSPYLLGFDRLNVFIGPNNTGKSRFIRQLFGYAKDIFLHNDDIVGKFNFRVLGGMIDSIRKAEAVYQSHHVTYRRYQSLMGELNSLQDEEPDYFERLTDLFKLIHPLGKLSDDDFLVTTKEAFNPRNRDSLNKQYQQAMTRVYRLLNSVPVSSTRNIKKLYVPILRGLRPVNKTGDHEFDVSDTYRERTMVDYFRNKPRDFNDKSKSHLSVNSADIYTGGSIYDDVMKLLLGDEDQRKIVFDFERFLEEQIFHENVTLIPKYKENVLSIKIGKERQQDIFDLGDGVQSIICILFPVFMRRAEPQLVFIEEPEMHLHSRWQRMLAEALLSFEKNQYFISSHSSAFINMPGSSVFKVSRKDNATLVHHLSLNEEKRRVVAELGYSAVDIVQANFILWVEGPSDRLYLNQWIKMLDDSLKEGRDYSILYLGGENYRHYLFDGDVVKVSRLQDVNNNFGVILDSDRTKSGENNKPEKRKIIDHFTSLGAFCWVTKAREIENYLPVTVYSEAIKAVHNFTDVAITDDLFERRTRLSTSEKADTGMKPSITLPADFFTKVQKNKDDLLKGILTKEIRAAVEEGLQKKRKHQFGVKKIPVARWVTDQEYTIENEEWQRKMKELVGRIKESNGWE